LPSLQKILVICPASLKLNWKRELEKWLVKPRTIFIADSKVCPEINGIVIINYDVLHKHEDVIKGTEWDMLICDEAHLCKNPKSRRTRMVVGCRASQKEKAAGMADIPGIDAKKRLLLTGTPIANRPIELYPLIHYLDPITWSSFWKYAARYTGASQLNQWDTSGACNLDELQDKLRSTIMVRRLKKDVLKELPPKTRKIVEIPANAEIRALLKQETEVYNEDEMDELETEAEFAKASDNPEDYKRAVAALKLRTKAKFEGLSTIRRELAVAKAHMPMVNELLEEALEDSPKLIIFAYHKEVIRLIADKFGSQAVVIVGDTPMHERQANVDRFQKDPSCKVIIGSIGAMGVGLTLTASSHVILFELDWVPGNVSQAEDRAHRIGQHDNVLVEHYVVEGSLDAVMAKRIIAKQNVIDQALDVITETRHVDADIPAPRGGTVVTFDKLAQEAALMTPKQRLAATLCIRQLAMMCNGARTHDGAGFNKLDTSIGRKLGFADTLTPKQCALARKISLKYVRQLQPDLVAQMQ
jgi:SNF2 family DNA or RNA helicase